MESNRTYHLIFKYGFLGLGLIIMSMPAISYILPEAFEFNGKTGSTDPITSIGSGVIGLILIVLFISIKHKFAIVALGNQTVTIKNRGQEITLKWIEIESISQFQFIFPPLYKLTTKGTKRTVWFNTEPNFISVGGYTTDNSKMGSLIKKKKRELSL